MINDNNNWPPASNRRDRRRYPRRYRGYQQYFDGPREATVLST